MDNSELSKAPLKRVEGVEQPLDDSLTKLSHDQAIKSLQLLRAKAEADTAEYKKRLVMQQFRPCQMYPVIIYHDGIRWVCSMGVTSDVYSEYLPDNAMGQSGVSAYGEYPEEAMKNFDAMWVGTFIEDLSDASDDDEEDDYGDYE